jgi:hypothetical protein
MTLHKSPLRVFTPTSIFSMRGNMTDRIIAIADRTEDTVAKIELLRRESYRLGCDIASLGRRKRELSASISVDPILNPNILNPLYLTSIIHAYNTVSDAIVAAEENKARVDAMIALAGRHETQS